LSEWCSELPAGSSTMLHTCQSELLAGSSTMLHTCHVMQWITGRIVHDAAYLSRDAANYWPDRPRCCIFVTWCSELLARSSTMLHTCHVMQRITSQMIHHAASLSSDAANYWPDHPPCCILVTWCSELLAGSSTMLHTCHVMQRITSQMIHHAAYLSCDAANYWPDRPPCCILVTWCS